MKLISFSRGRVGSFSLKDPSVGFHTVLRYSIENSGQNYHLRREREK
jgi:hypothetical protein